MHKPKSLRDWIKVYEEKTGDKAELPYGYRLCYLAERGFASMKPDIDGKMMIVYQVCGDGNFWRDYAELMAAGMGLDCVATICTRAIHPYIRSFGWNLLETQCVNGQYRYICQDSIGRKIVITHKDINETTGEPNYWVTQYLNEKVNASGIFNRKGANNNGLDFEITTS